MNATMNIKIALFALLMLITTQLAYAVPCSEDDYGYWCSAGPAEKELHFGYSRNTEEAFSITMHQVDASQFPIIGASVSILDEEGYMIPDIPPGLFRLTENNQVLPFELEMAAGSEGGVKIALVIDVSGSMGGEKLFNAKNAAMLFINSTKTLDRMAIVSYESWTTVIHEFTSVKQDLRDAIGDLYAGGGTAMYDGMHLALDLTKEERGVKAIIAFTDGMENSSSHSKQDVIDYANETGIPIFTIGFGNDADEEELTDIAEQTGGIYGFAPDGDRLSQLYLYLAKLVENEYMLIYRTPNEEYDRLPRVVEVCLNYWGEEKCTYGSYRATEPPRIILSEETKALSAPGYSHTPGTAIELKAIISDDEAVKQARVLWRQCGFEEHPYLENEMGLDQQGYYVCSFPPERVEYPGIEYFILASDESTTVSEPSFKPEGYPHKVAVRPNIGPIITHVPKQMAAVGHDLLLNMSVHDETNYVHSVVVLARPVGKLLYEEFEACRFVGDGSHIARIPRALMGEDGMEYCIYANDDNRVSSWHGSPDQPHFIRPHLMSQYPLYVYAKDKAGTEMPLAGASVYLNGEFAGSTDALGMLVLESLDLDDELFAIKSDAASIISTRGDHQDVDGTSFVMDLHNGSFTRSQGFKAFVTRDLVPSTPDNRQSILMSNVTIGVNLVVSIEFDASAAYIADVVSGLSAVSDLLFDATNGQFRINDVAIYDGKECWQNADIRISASNSTKPFAAIGGIDRTPDWLSSECCTIPWGFTRADGPLADNSLERLNVTAPANPAYFTDRHLTTELTHLLAHYLFSLLDENVDGNGDAISDRTADTPKRPRNFGLMDTPYLAAELSSWNEYPGEFSANAIVDDDAPYATLQMFETGLPCWSRIEQTFESISWSDSDYDIDIAVPGAVFYAQNGEDTEVPGPFGAGGLGEITISNKEVGAFDVTLLLSFEQQLIPDASVFVEGDRLSFKGRTDEDGRIILMGVEPGQQMKCYAANKEWLSPSYPYCVGEITIQAGKTLYQVECSRPASGEAEGEPTRAIVYGTCRTTNSNASLDLVVVAEDVIPDVPSVVVDSGALGKQSVGMSGATDNKFLGSIDLGMSASGAIQVAVQDSNGDISVCREPFLMHFVRADAFNEAVSADGDASVILRRNDISEDQALLVIGGQLLPPRLPEGKVLASNVYSFALEKDGYELREGTRSRLAFNMGRRFTKGVDCRSLTAYRYSTTEDRWLPLGGALDFASQTLSIPVDELGVFAVFGDVSADTTKPHAPANLTASGGQCESQVLLSFDAPADDGASEAVVGFQVRYSDSPIVTESDWLEAAMLPAPPTAAPGVHLDHLVDLPVPHTLYYFAMRSVDETGSLSDLAVASGKSPAAETLFFDAFSRNRLVELVWETASEVDNEGWHIWHYDADKGEFERLTQSPQLPDARADGGNRYAYLAQGLANSEPAYFVIENLCTDGSSSYSHLISAMPNGADVTHPPIFEVNISGKLFQDGDTLKIDTTIENQDETILVNLEVLLVQPDRRIIPISPSFPFILHPFERIERTVYTAEVLPGLKRGEYEVWARLREAATGAKLSKQDLTFTIE
ncbi:MAG: VWA domain-containing protein [Candidatus Coatesbacteria bacterium]|nr:VWA domain-containing protein [Candidatus Coatesbacteria bacterium]